MFTNLTEFYPKFIYHTHSKASPLTIAVTILLSLDTVIYQ